MTRPCRKDDPGYPWLCSCDDCCRGAAAAWTATIDRVKSGEISLDDAAGIHDEWERGQCDD